MAIIHHRTPASAEELLSLNHAKHFFHNCDVYAVTPSGVQLGRYHRIAFDDRYFANLGNNNLLRLSPLFYKQFERYEYLLIYELDSLVFAENLADFCSGEYDYIGAPWVRYENGQPVCFSGVGNSGFSLRRVDACLKVLTSRVRNMTPFEYWRKIGINKTGWKKGLGLLGAGSKFFRYRNDVNWFVDRYIYSPQRTWSPHEDKFWHYHAARFHPQFSLATTAQAVAFSFEHAPAFCFQANGNRLPLGCHAWFKHDEEFWRPYTL